MNWLTKYFCKQSNEDLLLSHIKKQYDFDNAIAIKKDSADFSFFVNLAAGAILEKRNSEHGFGVEPAQLEKLVNQINTELDFFIVKMTRNYMMSVSHEYALCFKTNSGYTMPTKYFSDYKLFGSFPILNEFEDDSYRYVRKMQSYQCVIIDNEIQFIPSYSFRLPLKLNSLLEDESKIVYNFQNNKESCTRDLEVIVEITTIDKNPQYLIKLFYGHNLLKQEALNQLPDLALFLNDFLFPYNMTEEEVSALGLSLPFEFSPDFLNSMNSDLKVTLEMLKI